MKHQFSVFWRGDYAHAIARKATESLEVGVTFCGRHINLRCAKDRNNGSRGAKHCPDCERAIMEETK